MRTKTLPRQQHKRLMARIMSHDEVLRWIKEVAGCLIIGIGILKGGTGKTTSTIYTALYWALHYPALKVAVIDTDENSQSVANWYRLREASGEDVPFDLIVHDVKAASGGRGPSLEETLEKLRDSYDVIVVDMGGGDKETYMDLCEYAHILLMTCAPSGIESDRVPPSLRVAKKSGRLNENATGLNIFVTLIKCDGRTTLPEEERVFLEAALEKEEIPDAMVPQEFQISGAPHYVRAWRETPKRTDLEEFGLLMKYMLKEVAA